MDHASFAAAFQAAARALWCIAAAIVRDRSAAQDVVQEAAVIALRKLDEFDPETSFTAWAGQIVRFIALNERRRRIRTDAAEAGPLEADTAPARPGSSGGLDAETRDRLNAAVETLDETAKACLLMKTVMGMSYADIAVALGVPEGTAMSHVHRSRQSLRSKLAPHWLGTARTEGGKP